MFAERYTVPEVSQHLGITEEHGEEVGNVVPMIARAA